VPVDSCEGTDHEIRTPKQGYLVGSTIDSTLPQGHAPPSDVPDPPTEKLRAHVIGFRLSVARSTLLCRYAVASNTVYGTVFQRGRSTLVGAPPAPIAAELERVWKATYRSGK